ncbi:hypothetical protein [Pseudobacteriovorax antillogorgiicola]|uniref:Uncharacterized protein n=1 Tax=Pseudobacteriovorax antillogorgiicola TaxID=1513793 RepID=A0A1Y6BZJ2_9BACT|nr:hypothetical protein [Pseudobacteriovorax antillogorgiicola]TCS53063.1 hypothetical protein EDD56_108114 [Pseudobacteriovorax antillogorgiicola]SMF26315.1 hypothetical protein SAMN06296036_108133 [Pseudobacteriovorax antillogorgiicola]
MNFFYIMALANKIVDDHKLRHLGGKELLELLEAIDVEVLPVWAALEFDKPDNSFSASGLATSKIFFSLY